ncbi:MAG: ABC transporter substrate-binding protein [Kutzneria sp.]|nr:ABC transporter substrate-binding protein [Kutzneria sp.]MBV9845612.1 ABC transporter substrate-binding protein [Kutzneria sp.]
MRASRGRRGDTATLLAALGAAAALLAGGCAGSLPYTADGEITVAGAKDTSGNLNKLIDVWNAAHPDKKARYVELAAESGLQRQQVMQNFLAHSPTYDAVITDDTWTTEFADKGWLAPLPADDFPPHEYFPAAVDAGTVGGTLYAAPYIASPVVLFYRDDLVARPPRTWSELIGDCAIAAAHQMGCYAGQFASYEGLTVNVTSAIRSAGGDILSVDGTRAVVDTPQARHGLEFLVNGFRQGYIPKEAITYQEEEGRRAFQRGSLLFLSNYSYVYARANTPGPDTAIAGKAAVAPIPGLDNPGVTSVGGHMMAVSAFSRHRQDTIEFVRYFTGEDNERQLLLKQSVAPVWRKLYDDPDLIKRFPFLPTLKESLERGRARPKTANYSALSLAVQTAAYAALQGAVSVDAALAAMSDQIDSALDGDR